MIDTHCHLLHALDDGPADLAEAVELARELAAAGVERVVCTPHFSRRYKTGVSAAEARLAELEEHVAREGVPLSLSLAAETSPAFAVSEPIAELSARTIEGRFLLVELEPATPAAVLETVLGRLDAQRLRPIFAHPERSRSVREQPRLLAEARAAGALVQVVAPSLTGRWGSSVGAGAWRLLDAGVVDLLASDSHRRGSGATQLARAGEAVAARYGDDVLAELTERAPARVLDAVAHEA